MSVFKRVAALAIALSATLASPLAAQTRVADNVPFFERISLGNLDMAAANIFYDDRCVDRELCFRSGSMAISVILFTDQGLREVILRLGERTRVPGGTLTLTDVGTPPSANGAIALDKYRLKMVFVPTPKARVR